VTQLKNPTDTTPSNLSQHAAFARKLCEIAALPPVK